MTGRRSAGLLLFRNPGPAPEVLIGHMGGPFWARRDHAAWSIPKGEHGDDEEALTAALREFEEELGRPAPEGPYLPLGDVRQAGGKTVTVWAVEADLDPETVVPGTFRMEWPRGSGHLQEFPELDRVAWLPLDRAAEKLVAGQRVFLDRLAGLLAA